eukprot:maker-scaffold_1-snap-gene-2.7-mRNA-1 protein AED:0.19 eAED:0.29 QI:0/0/0.5/1/0/0/2/257/71
MGLLKKLRPFLKQIHLQGILNSTQTQYTAEKGTSRNKVGNKPLQRVKILEDFISLRSSFSTIFVFSAEEIF